MIALGQRQLAAHPSPYRGLTCAQVHVQRHVHVVNDDRPYYFMPDGCAACGRQWFAEGEEMTMGFCWDCWPGNTLVLDEIEGFAVEPDPDPRPDPNVQLVEPARGRAKPVYPSASRFMDSVRADPRWNADHEPLICPQCGALTDLGHSTRCPLVARQI